MKVDKLWDMGYTGEGVENYRFYEGVDFDHPALLEKKHLIMIIMYKMV